ncbi:unnamed protein product [Spirodela intermedia]|uniref:Bulb-type lectin domain-containing protein n=2 Tax=Spirodela intermedia TaxID=51605 RepID=A0A7I8IFE8_SPIIN|nr:unnamed protein product [Spirodela intermedia]CAA6656526.1 unnamed protein product [Spirodela intermedia]CAA7392113.1 unnamed protein product [Spirodela intermedia]
MVARNLISLPLLILLCLLSSPCSARNTLRSGQTLFQRQSLNYNNYFFTMQSDCNLVLYDGGAVWASGTNGRATNCRATMQSDGNLVIYTGNRPVWASNTNGGTADYVLILQPDRNVVIYDGSRAIWATGTNVFGAGVTIAPRKNVTSTPAAVAVKKP